MPTIQFSHPQYLWLLPLIGAFSWWVLRGSLADLGRSRGGWALGVRLGVLTLLVLALAGLTLVRPTETLCTAFVVDVSDSIAPAQRDEVLHYIHRALKVMKPGDSAALVAFGSEALLDHAPEDRAAISKIVAIPGTSRTDIAAGIQLAMAGFPQESGKQIILFTDGNENLGNALDQAGLALVNDVRVSVVKLGRDTARGEALLLRAEIPPRVKEGAPFQVSVVAESLRETDGVVTLYRDNKPVQARKVHLKPGKTVLAFEQSLTRGGMHHYRALLDVSSEQDAVPDNNVADGYTRVSGKPRVLVVEGTPGDGAELTRALQTQHLEVIAGGPEYLPGTLAACAQYDSMVFANVPAWRLSPTQMSIIRSAVRDTGMGFAMVGGNESFGAGGYYHTPLEDALPVTMDVKKTKVLPSMTVVIVIDNSGSMTMEEHGVQKIRLAAEAAKVAVDLLQPIDQVCVIGYSTQDDFVYAVPLQRVENKARIFAQLDKLGAGGGGIMGYSSLLEARNVILGAHSQVKHLIYCADASDDEEYGNAIDLVHKLNLLRITTSVVGFGRKTDKDWPHFVKLARAGGGNAYVAERLGNLPQILTRDVMDASRSLLVEEPFRVLPQSGNHPIERHIDWAGSPPLLGYVSTSMKETPSATLLLSSPQDDPILAAWPYGLGRTIAFTSDATAHWGAHWLSWPSYASFWAQALRWTLRQEGRADFQTMVHEDHGRATILVDALTPEGEFRNLVDLRAHVACGTGEGIYDTNTPTEMVPLQQTAPGHYEGTFQARANGAYVVTVEEREHGKSKATQMVTLVIPYSPEFQAVAVNTHLLAQITERTKGIMEPLPEDVYGKLRFGSRTLRDLWGWLLLAATVLFLFDVAVRRLLLSWRKAIDVCWEIIAPRLPAWRFAGRTRTPAAPTHVPTLGSLLNTKEQRRQPRDLSAVPPPIIPPVQPPAPPPAAPPSPPADTSQAPTVSALLQKKRERQGK